MMLVPMLKVHVIGHRRRLDACLATLQRLQVLHLIDVAEDSTVRLPPLAVDETRLHELEDLRFLRVRLDSLLAIVPASTPAPRIPDQAVDLEQVRSELDEVGPSIENLARHLDELEAERETLPRHLDALRRLLPLVPEMTQLNTYDTMAVILDIRHAGVLAELNASLAEMLGGNYEIISDQVDTDTVGAIVVFPSRARNDVEAVFGREQVSRVRLPKRFESIPFKQAITAMEHRLAELDGEIAVTRTRIGDLLRPLAHWRVASRMLAARIEQLGAIRRLGATHQTFVVSAWMPRRRLPELVEALAAEVGPDVLVEEAAPDADDRAPILFENPAPVRPFQTLVRLLSLPRYGTLDPSSLMAIFLPLFFGMMLGDIVYGAVVLIAALTGLRYLRKKQSALADLVRVLVLCGAWSVVWGIIYGELLGNLGHSWFGLEPLWVNREEALEPLLIFTLAVGGAHILLGLLLGVWQAGRTRDRHALLERIGNLIALIGLFFIVGVVADLLPEGLMTPSVAAVVIGLAILIVIAGPMGVLMGPLELIGTVGNILSYLRIAAIGLASVYLAKVANELGATGPLWLGVVVATLFHILNLVLGTFSPTIQALRLHYVEFFGKFYTEGGEPYSPFGAGVDPAAETEARSREAAPV